MSQKDTHTPRTLSPSAVPKLLFINENAALIVCSKVPAMGTNEMQNVKQLEGDYCRRVCGYWRDAALRNQQVYNASGGKRNFKLMCFSPQSPYLEETMKKLRESGNL